MVSDFNFEIKEVTRHKEAELNQELFDKVFGEGVVSSEEEFIGKIKELLAEQFEPQVNYKFLLDARDLLLKKAGNPVFADDLLKRWLAEANEKKTKEEIDAEYPNVLEDLKFQLIKEYLVKEQKLEVKDEDVEAYAVRVAKSQFAQYGMYSAPEDVLASYAKDMLKNKETLQNVIDRVVEDKLVECLKGLVKIEAKEVTMDEFTNLLN